MSLIGIIPGMIVTGLLIGNVKWTIAFSILATLSIVFLLIEIVLFIYLNRITFRLLMDWMTAKKSVVEETVLDIVESDRRYSGLSPAPRLLMNNRKNIFYLETGGQWREVERDMLSSVVVGDTLTLHLAPYSGLVLGVEQPKKP
jgi:hypothetical protein